MPNGIYFAAVNTIYESGGGGSSVKLTDLYITINGTKTNRCYTGGGGSATNVVGVIAVPDNPKLGVDITLYNLTNTDVHISAEIFLIGIT